uniref:ERAP1_C domain-containing protein n=1 Tax=Caenorhabditis tropicalis TaxID=1561998 RepID=A0A1I7V3V8_9PELO
MFQFLAKCILGVTEESWKENKSKLIKGESEKKYYPEDITKWIPCKGTPKEIQKEISKFPELYKRLQFAKNDPIALKCAVANMSHHANVVTAEWRLFYKKRGVDPMWIKDKVLQEAADRAYNNWRDFQAVIFELLHKTFRSEEDSMNAILLFIADQDAAIKTVVDFYSDE